jgi:hypothetical protein
LCCTLPRYITDRAKLHGANKVDLEHWPDVKAKPDLTDIKMPLLIRMHRSTRLFFADHLPATILAMCFVLAPLPCCKKTRSGVYLTTFCCFFDTDWCYRRKDISVSACYKGVFLAFIPHSHGTKGTFCYTTGHQRSSFCHYIIPSTKCPILKTLGSFCLLPKHIRNKQLIRDLKDRHREVRNTLVQLMSVDASNSELSIQ